MSDEQAPFDDRQGGGLRNDGAGVFTVVHGTAGVVESHWTWERWIRGLPMATLLPRLRQEFRGYSRSDLQANLLAGLTVAAVALPLALAFSVASGASAAARLVTAIIAGVLLGVLGGAPFQISGPTGAMSAVLIVVSSRYGLPGVWISGVMAGALILLMGVVRMGRVVSYIPSPVITGFTSGIANIIAFGQLDNVLGIGRPALP
jgi:sulfate permease, SulP family